METPRLQLKGIVKRYPGVLANDHVDLAVMPGEIHALLGENGAGKSTLVKIIYGVVHADEGEITWEGRPVRIADPHAARGLGIGMVFQHFNLFQTLTVTENIALGLDGRKDLTALADEIERVASHYGLAVDPRRHVHDLSVGERQRVEIIRCLLQDPKLIIMDEPTSVLTPQEAESLFITLRRLAGEGRSVLYISHKLEEIRALCDTATVLRGGRAGGHCDPREETPASLARMMIGHELPEVQRARARTPGAPVLTVERLSVPARDVHGTPLSDISFAVRAGEILGIAGVAGNGQRALLGALNGEIPASRADMVTIDGVPAGRLSTGRRRALGLAHVPEERLSHGAVAAMSLTANALLTAHGKGLVRNGLVDFARARAFARRIIERFRVAAPGPETEARSLSGGNLQKFIVGREIALEPRILLLGYPTWGVDAGAAAAIRQEIIDLAGQGAAVVVVSEDLDELFELADHIAVIAGGRLSPLRAVGEAGVEELGTWMSGGFPGAGTQSPTEPAHAG